LLPAQGEPVLWVTRNNHHANACELARIGDVRRAPRNPHALISAEIRKRGLSAGRVGLVGNVFYKDVDGLRRDLPSSEFPDASEAIKRLRSQKSDEELAFQRKAAEGCDAVMEALRREIRPGVDERDILVASEAAAWASGCAPTFLYLNSTSTFDSDSCVPNQFPSRRKIRPGDVINTELTVNYAMYCSQILRPFFVGEPSAEYERIYRLTKKVYDELRGAIRAGTSLGELHRIALQIGDAGFTTVDGIAHGFGVDIQPPGRVPHALLPPADPEERLAANTTYVIQPNPTTTDHRAGMQLGDMGVITDSGFDVVHRYPAEVTRL
jgi:Xaa-Pro aminopeptidase